MKLNKNTLIGSIFIVSAACVGYTVGYQQGMDKRNRQVADSSQTYGSMKMITEITDKVGYKTSGINTEDMKIIDYTDIKDLRYYLVEINGIKTVAAHE